MRRIIVTLMVCSIILFILTGYVQVSHAQPVNEFPFPLSSQIPNDVDNNKLQKFIKDQEFAKAQRLFDLNSWQTFLALNWPLNDSRQPLPNITDKGTPQWETWKESSEVFLPDGSAPAPW